MQYSVVLPGRPLTRGLICGTMAETGAVSPVHFRLTKEKGCMNMKDCNCGYCMGGDILAGFGIKICDLDVSQRFFLRSRATPAG